MTMPPDSPPYPTSFVVDTWPYLAVYKRLSNFKIDALKLYAERLRRDLAEYRATKSLGSSAEIAECAESSENTKPKVEDEDSLRSLVSSMKTVIHYQQCQSSNAAITEFVRDCESWIAN